MLRLTRKVFAMLKHEAKAERLALVQHVFFFVRPNEPKNAPHRGSGVTMLCNCEVCPCSKVQHFDAEP